VASHIAVFLDLELQLDPLVRIYKHIVQSTCAQSLPVPALLESNCCKSLKIFCKRFDGFTVLVNSEPFLRREGNIANFSYYSTIFMNTLGKISTRLLQLAGISSAENSNLNFPNTQRDC